MFRQFRFTVPTFAWAGCNPADDWFVRHWFQHGERRGRPHGPHGNRRGRHGEEPFEHGWGDETRTQRGGIKFILLELLSDRPSHGYDLIKAMESRYGGFRRLSPGSVYPTLQLLEEGGYLTSEPKGGKRVYTITEAGRELLAERMQQTDSRSSDAVSEPPPEFVELRNAATELAAVVTQVARSGNGERINRVREKLDRVKREIYAMLAEE